MNYALTQGLTNAKRSADLARENNAHWVRLADQTLVWSKAEIMMSYERHAHSANVDLVSVKGHETAGEMYLVGQIGLAFQKTFPDIKILINKGRYLVAELLPEEIHTLNDYDQLYWKAQPLPLDRVILDVQERESMVREEVVGWVENLASSISESTYNGYLGQLTDFYTRHSLRTEYDDAAALAMAELQRLEYEVRLQPISIGANESVNLIADSPGQSSGSRELIIITAHLDAINTSGGMDAPAPGADDNASGSAALLEVARVLANHPASHDLRLILFGGEEQGRRGSIQYVAGMTDVERGRVRAVINMDMIATLNTSHPTVLLESSATFQPLINQMSNAALNYTDLTVQTSLHPFASDHVAFIEAGIPALLTIEGADGSNVNVHTVNDTLDHLNYGLALDILRMNVAATCSMLGIEPSTSTWATCTVNRIGPAENGTIYIHLRDIDETFNHWFQAYPGKKNEMLATALEAIRKSATVTVYLENTAAYSQIYRLYVSSNESESNPINSAISMLLLEETEGMPFSNYLLTLT